MYVLSRVAYGITQELESGTGLSLSAIEKCLILNQVLVQSRRTRGVLKIERHAQRLTLRACMGEASYYSWVPPAVLFTLRDSGP